MSLFFVMGIFLGLKLGFDVQILNKSFMLSLLHEWLIRILVCIEN